MLQMQRDKEKQKKHSLLIDIEDLDTLWTGKNPEKTLSVVDKLSKQFTQLQITLKDQSKEIDVLKMKQIKLEQDRENLKARLLLTGVSDGIVAQYQRLISSLSNTALVKLASDSEIKALLQKIDLSKVQSENDVLVGELITIVREKEQNLHKNGVVMSAISKTTLLLSTVALKFYAPALASMAVESVFENGFDNYIPDDLQNLYQPVNGGFFKFAVVAPAKHHAMNFAFNTVSENDTYTLAASYAISNILTKCTGWLYSGGRTAVNSAYLHLYQGKENNNLYSLLVAMKHIQAKKIPQIVEAKKIDKQFAIQASGVVEQQQDMVCFEAKEIGRKSVVVISK